MINFLIDQLVMGAFIKGGSAGNDAITYENQDEVLLREHRNGVHKYEAHFQAPRSI